MATSFASDIKPMFRPVDIEHMKNHGVLLDNFPYMSHPENDHGNARTVLETVVGNPPSMPPGGPYWTAEQVALYKKWMDGGFQP
jgi:hypothetical protein